MGYSCTSNAAKVVDKFEDYCRAQTGKSNCWIANGKEYFYEISRRDQSDMGICGYYCVSLSETTCKRVGTFKVDGDGVVVRGPAVLKAFSAQPPQL